MASRAVEYTDRWLVLSDSEHGIHKPPSPLRIVLRYDPDDPLEVRFEVFGGDNEWHFARDLLILGLNGPAGLGDVRVWPQGQDVCVAFSSPDGSCLFLASRRQLRRFLAKTTALVPAGEESWHLDIPDDVAELLPEVSE